VEGTHAVVRTGDVADMRAVRIAGLISRLRQGKARSGYRPAEVKTGARQSASSSIGGSSAG
jgi:hypothetical protein